MFPADAIANHAALSETNRQFLEFVAKRPEAFSADFPGIQAIRTLFPFTLQPWPTFIDRSLLDDLERGMRALFALIAEVPRRLLGNDPRKIAEVYGVGDRAAEILHFHELAANADAMIGRADLVPTAAGFKCLEFNVGGGLGGYQSAVIARVVQSLPFVQQFLAESGVRTSSPDTICEVLENIISWVEKRDASARECIVAVVGFDPGTRGMNQSAVKAFLSAQLGNVANAHSQLTKTDVHFCRYDELRCVGETLRLGDEIVNVIVDQYATPYDERVVEPLRARRLLLIDGPGSEILSDKRTLALLSEAADDGRLSASDDALVRRWVPWTRVVKPKRTRFRDEEVSLPSLLERAGDSLVLKAARGSGGTEVHFGNETPATQWTDLVARALEGGGWVVQERLDPLLYVAQSQDGWALHRFGLGIFAIGDRDGGCYLRMIPETGGLIVNTSRGGTDGIALVVETVET